MARVGRAGTFVLQSGCDDALVEAPGAKAGMLRRHVAKCAGLPVAVSGGGPTHSSQSLGSWAPGGH